MVQWLGLCALTDKSAGLIPEKGIKISQAVWYSQKIGKEVEYQWLLTLQKRYNLTSWERPKTMKDVVFQKQQQQKLLNLTTKLLEVQDTEEYAEYTTDTPSATQKL